MAIQIDPEFKALIPPLSSEEYTQLEQNLIKESNPDSIVLFTWNGIMIDGHNRYEICQKHNISFKTAEKNGFSDRDDVKVWIIQNQFGRRNLNLYSRNKLALSLKEILEKKAKEKEALRKTIQQTKPLELNEAEQLLNIQSDGHYFGDLLRGNTQPSHATPDCIYFIQDGGKVKIGVSCDIDSRLKDVTKHLPDAKLIGSCKGDIALEKSLHKTLSEHKINNEWFKLNAVTVSIIKAFVPGADFSQLGKVNSWEEISKKLDTSKGSMDRVKLIEQKAAPEVKKELETGTKSINEVYKEIRKEEKEEARKEEIAQLKFEIEQTPEPPDGKYDVIVVDPPWQMDGDYDPEHWRGVPAYPTLSIKEITDLEIPSNDNCILFFWVINKRIHDAIHIIDAWGFEIKNMFTWVKDKFGVGPWGRGQTEHFFVCVKGKPLVDFSAQSTVIMGIRREHSRKPEGFYQMVDKTCNGRKLDYFSREKRDGWSQFGNDTRRF